MTDTPEKLIADMAATKTMTIKAAIAFHERAKKIMEGDKK